MMTDEQAGLPGMTLDKAYWANLHEGDIVTSVTRDVHEVWIVVAVQLKFIFIVEMVSLSRGRNIRFCFCVNDRMPYVLGDTTWTA